MGEGEGDETGGGRVVESLTQRRREAESAEKVLIDFAIDSFGVLENVS